MPSTSNPSTTTTTTHGGRRLGSGRVRRRFTLDAETARILREIVRRWRATDDPIAQWSAPRALDSLVWREALRMGMLEPEQVEHWQAVARGEEG